MKNAGFQWEASAIVRMLLPYIEALPPDEREVYNLWLSSQEQYQKVFTVLQNSWRNVPHLRDRVMALWEDFYNDKIVFDNLVLQSVCIHGALSSVKDDIRTFLMNEMIVLEKFADVQEYLRQSREVISECPVVTEFLYYAIASIHDYDRDQIMDMMENMNIVFDSNKVIIEITADDPLSDSDPVEEVVNEEYLGKLDDIVGEVYKNSFNYAKQINDYMLLRAHSLEGFSLCLTEEIKKFAASRFLEGDVGVDVLNEAGAEYEIFGPVDRVVPTLFGSRVANYFLCLEAKNNPRFIHKKTIVHIVNKLVQKTWIIPTA